VDRLRRGIVRRRARKHNELRDGGLRRLDTTALFACLDRQGAHGLNVLEGACIGFHQYDKLSRCPRLSISQSHDTLCILRMGSHLACLFIESEMQPTDVVQNMLKFRYYR